MEVRSNESERRGRERRGGAGRWFIHQGSYYFYLAIISHLRLSGVSLPGEATHHLEPPDGQAEAEKEEKEKGEKRKRRQGARRKTKVNSIKIGMKRRRGRERRKERSIRGKGDGERSKHGGEKDKDWNKR